MESSESSEGDDLAHLGKSSEGEDGAGTPSMEASESDSATSSTGSFEMLTPGEPILTYQIDDQSPDEFDYRRPAVPSLWYSDVLPTLFPTLKDKIDAFNQAGNYFEFIDGETGSLQHQLSSDPSSIKTLKRLLQERLLPRLDAVEEELRTLRHASPEGSENWDLLSNMRDVCHEVRTYLDDWKG